MKNRGGQMKLSFGMIFSIILIIVFISFAFYAIYKFLDIKGSIEVGKFINDFQGDVNKMWKGSQGSEGKSYSLPSEVEFVCFVDYNLGSVKQGSKEMFYSELKQNYYENENLFFYPIGSSQGVDSAVIDNIDLSTITQDENPYCIEVKKGKVSVTIKKEFGNNLVFIE